MPVAIHVTHEAIQKIGGIGAVLEGLIPSGCHKRTFPKTLLYTPLFSKNDPMERRLGDRAEVLYSGIDQHDGGSWKKVFSPIEKKFGVQIVYGKKDIVQESTGKSAKIDIVAVDIWDMKAAAVNLFKFQLWENFKIKSDKYLHDTDYEQYMRIGAVLPDIFEAIYGKVEKAVLFSHEYMGMPSALAFIIQAKAGHRAGDRTIFYAHEVSTARSIVENHPGHDLAFYNILRFDIDRRESLEEEFGSFASFSRNELVKCAANLDFIYAVSDITKEEYLYLCPDVDPDKIHVVYNGIEFNKCSYDDKKESFGMVADYCERLFNYRPDFLFTHVTRMVISKGIWRDLRLLYTLDEELSKTGKKGFYVLLSTLIGSGRPESDIVKMESDYGWPVLHREGWPDLVGYEIDVYRQMEIFNSRSRSIKGVLLNQFGFTRARCGSRMPEAASFHRLRMASDMEFGMSIYEPFGIAQLETFPYGGIPVLSSSCGCASLLKDAASSENFIEVDFIKVPARLANIFKDKAAFKDITKEIRDRAETEVCRDYTSKVFASLPATDRVKKSRFERMQEEAKGLCWEEISRRVCEPLR